MFDEVWSRIVQHRYEKQAAALSGYRRLAIKGENYPALVKSFGSSVEGVVYRNVTVADIKRLDQFEGEYYKNIAATVVTESGCRLNVRVYLFNTRYKKILSNTPWDPARFQSQHLQKFIRKYSGF